MALSESPLDEFPVVIIGAGVIGLAVAAALAPRHNDLVVLEQHTGFGFETSSRNSEVIHAGLYYPPGSLKARLCIAGQERLYPFCAQNAIPHRRCGKLIVANTDDEQRQVEALYQNGLANGVTGLKMVNRPEIKLLEPMVTARLALLCPSTGILDSHALMRHLERRVLSAGAFIAYQTKVVGIEYRGSGFGIETVQPNGEALCLTSPLIINAAGLHADQIARLVGIDTFGRGYQIFPCKGEYFRVADRHRGAITRLVYPTPTHISLGIHTRLSLDGALALGPNAFYVDQIDYSVNENHQDDFYFSVREFLPFIQPADLSPDMAGIRPKLQPPGGPPRDFVICAESAFPGLINLIGIDSPGLTAALAIAEMVAELVRAL